MKRRHIFIYVIFLITLIPLILTSCPPSGLLSQYRIRVSGDRNGGAFAIYGDTLSGNIYVKKISSDGEMLWGDKGVLLVTGNKNRWTFYGLNIISDNPEEVIVAWPDASSSFNYLARLDYFGKIVWQHKMPFLEQIIVDKNGGVIVAFDINEHLSVSKIDAEGNYPWGEKGIELSSHANHHENIQITSDGAGGAIIVWNETVSPGIDHIFAQRVNAYGKMVWGDNVSVLSKTGGDWVRSLQVTEDSNGGAIVAWLQTIDLGSQDGKHISFKWDVLAQKINSDGSVCWDKDGVSLLISQESSRHRSILIINNGIGGAVIGWTDSQMDTYAQTLDTEGKILWQPGGVKVSHITQNPYNLYPQIANNGSGGAIFAYDGHDRGLRIQNIDINSNLLWGENGVAITQDGFDQYSMSSDGNGGAIIGWGIDRVRSKKEFIQQAFIQKVGSDGKLLWGKDGITLNN
jgi:hypothetical protein